MPQHQPRLLVVFICTMRLQLHTFHTVSRWHSSAFYITSTAIAGAGGVVGACWRN